MGDRTARFWNIICCKLYFSLTLLCLWKRRSKSDIQNRACVLSGFLGIRNIYRWSGISTLLLLYWTFSLFCAVFLFISNFCTLHLKDYLSNHRHEKAPITRREKSHLFLYWPELIDFSTSRKNLSSVNQAPHICARFRCPAGLPNRWKAFVSKTCEHKLPPTQVT